jgi:hypothetical protein
MCHSTPKGILSTLKTTNQTFLMDKCVFDGMLSFFYQLNEVLYLSVLFKPNVS